MASTPDAHRVRSGQRGGGGGGSRGGTPGGTPRGTPGGSSQRSGSSHHHHHHHHHTPVAAESPIPEGAASPSLGGNTHQLDFYQAMVDFRVMFPNMDEEIIEAVLRANNGAVDATIDQLLTMNVDTTPDDGPQPPLPSAQASSTAAAATASSMAPPGYATVTKTSKSTPSKWSQVIYTTLFSH